MDIEKPEAEQVYELRERYDHFKTALVFCTGCGRGFTPSRTDLAEANAEEAAGEYPSLYCPTCRARDFED